MKALATLFLLALCISCTLIAGRNNTVERQDHRHVETAGTNRVSGTVIKITP